MKHFRTSQPDCAYPTSAVGFKCGFARVPCEFTAAGSHALTNLLQFWDGSLTVRETGTGDSTLDPDEPHAIASEPRGFRSSHRASAQIPQRRGIVRAPCSA